MHGVGGLTSRTAGSLTQPATSSRPGAGIAQDTSSERSIRKRRSKRSRRRPDVVQSQQQFRASSAVQQTATIFRLPACLRAPMINLGRIIDNALDVAESLLATDFSADYLLSKPAKLAPFSTDALRPPPATIEAATAATEHNLRLATPSRSGAAVQAARAVCEKLSSALAATEAARISTQIANLKLTNTPPHLRPHPFQQYQHPQLTDRSGHLASRELRFCSEASPVRSSTTIPFSNGAPAASAALTAAPTASASTVNSGFATARGPLSAPLTTLTSMPVLASTERPSPLRALLTSRPSRPAGVPPLVLQGTAMQITPTAQPLHPRDQQPHPYHEKHPQPAETQSQLQYQHQHQHQYQQAPNTSSAPAVPRLMFPLPPRHHATTNINNNNNNSNSVGVQEPFPIAVPAAAPETSGAVEVSAAVQLSKTQRGAGGADDPHSLSFVAVPQIQPESRLPPSPTAHAATAPCNGPSVSHPRRLGIPVLGLQISSSKAHTGILATPAGTGTGGVGIVAKSALSPVKVAAATGVLPPGDYPLHAAAAAAAVAPARGSIYPGEKADKVMVVKGVAPAKPVSMVVPTLRLPLEEGTAPTRSGAPGPMTSHQSRGHASVSEDGAGGSVMGDGGGAVDAASAGLGLEVSGVQGGEERRPGPRPVVPGLRLGALAR